MRPIGTTPPSLIHLNVQGTKVTVDSNLLTKYPDTPLAAQISGSATAMRDEKQRIFVNSNPETFHHLLTFLRDDALPALSSEERERLFGEAKLLGYQSMVSVEEARVIACAEPIRGMPGAVERTPYKQSWDCLDRYLDWSDALAAAGCSDASFIVFMNVLSDDCSRQCERYYERKLAEVRSGDLAQARLSYILWRKNLLRHDPSAVESLRALQRSHAEQPEFNILLANVLLAPEHDYLQLFTRERLASGTSKVLALCEADGAEVEAAAKDALGDALKQTGDAFAAVRKLSHLTVVQLRSLQTFLDAAYGSNGSDADSDCSGFRPIASAWNGERAYHVAFNGSGFFSSINGDDQVIEACARRIKEVADTQEAIALFRAAVESAPDAVSTQCAFARSLLRAQWRMDLAASHDPTLLEEYRVRDAADSDDDSDTSESSGDSRRHAQYQACERPLVAGSAGVAWLREGIEQLEKASVLPPVRAAMPFDDAASVALIYTDDLGKFLVAKSPSTADAREAYELLRRFLRGWYAREPQRLHKLSKYDFVVTG